MTSKQIWLKHVVELGFLDVQETVVGLRVSVVSECVFVYRKLKEKYTSFDNDAVMSSKMYVKCRHILYLYTLKGPFHYFPLSVTTMTKQENLSAVKSLYLTSHGELCRRGRLTVTLGVGTVGNKK